MKMVMIDETTLDAKVIDIRPQEMREKLEELMPEMRCIGSCGRIIGGREFDISHDDEFLFHRYNFTGICENGQEILMGTLIISAYKDDDDYTDDDDKEDGDWGLRDLTDEEVDIILKAWHPIKPELAERYCKEVDPQCLFMMGSNALHYDW